MNATKNTITAKCRRLATATGNPRRGRIREDVPRLRSCALPLPRRNRAWQRNLLTSPYLRIAGGTDEIQRNIIAERILGLPADKGDNRRLPFNQLVRG
ncbi:acyl-CoA dehydrogenase family protein [Arthrobacter sp. AZCC_0090]|uniref:acyl-CoA dehydrogenase family protein n=1 Tax=Arthrobacter sp. AZCC_0090 TaxID=2735881 RepID=UPI00289376C9|nr:acyl-CoA dehydrogenase family protein [Arthrobacter sp. AZCC_0090]